MSGRTESEGAMPAPAARVRPFDAVDLAACVAIGNAAEPDHPTSLAAAQHRDAAVEGAAPRSQDGGPPAGRGRA